MSKNSTLIQSTMRNRVRRDKQTLHQNEMKSKANLGGARQRDNSGERPDRGKILPPQGNPRSHPQRVITDILWSGGRKTKQEDGGTSANDLVTVFAARDFSPGAPQRGLMHVLEMVERELALHLGFTDHNCVHGVPCR